jgi:hypothetical protein
MNGRGGVNVLWEMLTHVNDSVFVVNKYGLESGCEGSLVVYDTA